SAAADPARPAARARAVAERRPRRSRRRHRHGDRDRLDKALTTPAGQPRAGLVAGSSFSVYRWAGLECAGEDWGGVVVAGASRWWYVRPQAARAPQVSLVTRIALRKRTRVLSHNERNR